MRVPSNLLVLALVLPLGFSACSSGSSAGLVPGGGGGRGGGGGGSGGPGGSPQLNAGEFSISAFGYRDPHSPSFHPLGARRSFVASTKSEALIFANNRSGSAGWIHEDSETGFQLSSPLAPALLGGMVVHGAASGNADDDGCQEVAVVGLVENGGVPEILVQILEQSPSSTLHAPASAIAGTAQVAYRSADVAMADVDGDSRDEIIVTGVLRDISEGTLCILDDLAAGLTVLHTATYAGAVELRPAAIELDGDPGEELAVVRRVGTQATAELLDDAARGFTYLGEVLGTSSARGKVAVVPGNFDTDGYDEVALAWTNQREQPEIAVFDDLAAGLGPIRAYSVGSSVFGVHPRYPSWDLTAGDTDGSSIDELHLGVVAEGKSFIQSDVVELHVVGFELSGHSTRTYTGPKIPAHSSQFGRATVDLATFDDDGDTRDEVLMTCTPDENSLDTWRLDTQDKSWTIAGRRWWNSNRSPSTPPPLIVGIDLDGDGLVLRYTGNKQLTLPDPVPIVVMAAPPTKSGVGQDVEGSSVSYGVANSTASTYSWSVGATLSASRGSSVNVNLLFTKFEAEMKAKFTASYGYSQGTTTERTIETGYQGPHDADTIVFVGSLHHTYLYEVTASADPTAIGQVIALNAPVMDQTFFWELDHYNAIVDPDDRIEVLNHGIGDPASYMSSNDANALLARTGGVSTEVLGGVAVQQAGPVTQSLSLSRSNTKTHTFEWSLELEFEVKAGPVTYGGSVGFSNGYAWEVTESQTTTYSATLGAIRDFNSYLEWGYQMGLVVYTEGIELSPQGVPTVTGKPYRVVTYWTNPTGRGYVP